MFGYPKVGTRWGRDRVVAVAEDAITMSHGEVLTYLEFAARYL